MNLRRKNHTLTPANMLRLPTTAKAILCAIADIHALLSSGSLLTSRAVMMRVAVMGDILYTVYPFDAIRILINSNFIRLILRNRGEGHTPPTPGLLMAWRFLFDVHLRRIEPIFRRDRRVVWFQGSSCYTDTYGSLIIGVTGDNRGLRKDAILVVLR